MPINNGNPFVHPVTGRMVPTGHMYTTFNSNEEPTEKKTVGSSASRRKKEAEDNAARQADTKGSEGNKG